MGRSEGARGGGGGSGQQIWLTEAGGTRRAAAASDGRRRLLAAPRPQFATSPPRLSPTTCHSPPQITLTLTPTLSPSTARTPTNHTTIQADNRASLAPSIASKNIAQTEHNTNSNIIRNKS